jgi:ribonuclease-3
MLAKTLKNFQYLIKYTFKSSEILVVALTHRSCSVESDKKKRNGRMEFLGDSIISAVVAETLYLRYPTEDEGKLSQLKAYLVSSCNLSSWSRKINLENYMFFGKNENTKKNRQKDGLLCDMFESVTGAIYLDGGFESAKKFILNFLNDEIEIVVIDHRSQLQEIVQCTYKKLPVYKIIREFGPKHDRRFVAIVYVKNELFGKGIGSSKKEACKLAAKQAIENVDQAIKISKA